MWKNIEQIKEIIENSFNKTDILNKLELKNHGGNYNTLSSFIKENNINISHFETNKITKSRGKEVKYSIEEILRENSPYKSTCKLKNKLYKLGLKERICELCGQTEEWKGKKMALILDHINGDRHNNSIENLRIVCANCNATLETHCRGLNLIKKDYWDVCDCGKKKRIESVICKKCFSGNKYDRHDICECGEKKKKESITCKSCYTSKKKKVINVVISKEGRRKVERPSYEELLKEIEELGYSGTGRKYNVSDNSIRKWKKMYEKYGENF